MVFCIEIGMGNEYNAMVFVLLHVGDPFGPCNHGITRGILNSQEEIIFSLGSFDLIGSIFQGVHTLLVCCVLYKGLFVQPIVVDAKEFRITGGSIALSIYGVIMVSRGRYIRHFAVESGK